MTVIIRLEITIRVIIAAMSTMDLSLVEVLSRCTIATAVVIATVMIIWMREYFHQ